jgi:NET1-associated nuclear protein 1 (U3 small nucleolar RNA-associated protein 17)
MSAAAKTSENPLTNNFPIGQRKLSKKLDTKSALSASITTSPLASRKKGQSKARIREKKTDGTNKENVQMKPVVEQALAEKTSVVELKKQKSKKSKKSAHISNIGVGKKLGNSLTWKHSPHLGGRYLALDPAYSPDDKYVSFSSLCAVVPAYEDVRYLFVAQPNSLKIYATKTSLLVRTIALPTTGSHQCLEFEEIVSYFLDPRADDRIYVATSFAHLFLFNTANGEQIDKWTIQDNTRHVCVCMDQDLEGSESEVVYVVTDGNKGTSDVWCYSLSSGVVLRSNKIYTAHRSISAISVVDRGWTVCLISGKSVVIINRDGSGWTAPRVYMMASQLTCMDAYLSRSSVETNKSKKGKKGSLRPTGDIVVGDSTGTIYILHDIIRSGNRTTEHTPQKLHWHRVSVSSVKWALGGMVALWSRKLFVYLTDLLTLYRDIHCLWRFGDCSSYLAGRNRASTISTPFRS